MPKQQFIADLERRWASSPRWAGIARPYGAEDVWRLKGSLDISYTLAEVGANKLWRLLHDEPYVAALSAVSGGQAVQEVKAGLKAIYISGWQVAGDMNTSQETYPDQSLYPADSVPRLVERINNALQRADEIDHMNGRTEIDWYAPLVADAEAGFGGLLNAYELMKHMIQKGASGVHFEDQLASLKKCGHLGGKVLVPTSEFITKLVAARLASDVLDVPTVLIARTDALSATILANDIDPYDREFVIGDRTPEGFVAVQPGIRAVIARGLAYAPYADLLWFETSKPDMEQAQEFAEAIHAKYPGKMMAYNCSPSFNWKRHLSDAQIASFQSELGAMGYKFQFVTLSAFHAMNYAMFELAKGYKERGMAAYSELQQKEFAAEQDGYEAVRHQEFVGVPYFDQVTDIVTGGRSSSIAMKGSTEEEQFHERNIASATRG